MNATSNILTKTQSRGRTFFICALLLLAVMLFKPIATSLFSGERDLGDSIIASVIYILILIAAFRGGFLSIKIIKGCLGIFAGILAIAVIFVGIGASISELPPPRLGWDIRAFLDFIFLVPLFYIYWALFFSKSVKEFITYQREYFHAREMQAIKETTSRTRRCS